MLPKRKSAPDKATKEAPQLPLQDEVQTALAWLESKSTQRDRENLARFAISTSKFFGVSMTNMKVLAKDLGRNHELAAALWDTGWYEARMLASLVDEPARVTAAQMDRWCRDFDNWAICDTACFCLFDRTPHAFRKVEQWSRKSDEFVKRAAFALLASLALHDKSAPDEAFADCLPLIEAAATDDRNFVKKGVSWALRAVGGRKFALHAPAVALAERLIESDSPVARWIGRDAYRELTGPIVRKRLAARAAKEK
jgi:3-methyladenine DNA glycosylase AlkD